MIDSRASINAVIRRRTLSTLGVILALVALGAALIFPNFPGRQEFSYDVGMGVLIAAAVGLLFWLFTQRSERREAELRDALKEVEHRR